MFLARKNGINSSIMELMKDKKQIKENLKVRRIMLNIKENAGIN